jgi:hypothetical protein
MKGFEIDNGLLGLNKCVLLKLVKSSIRRKIREYILNNLLMDIQCSNKREYIMKYAKRMNFFNKNKEKFNYYIQYFIDNDEQPIDFDNNYKITLNGIPQKIIDYYQRRLFQNVYIDNFDLERNFLGFCNETYETKYYNFELITNIIKDETINTNEIIDELYL